MAEETGLVEAWDRVLLGTYKAMPIHMPGQVLGDLAVAIADGAVSISDLAALRDQPDLFGSVASTPTAWRVLDRVSGDLLAGIRQGRGLSAIEWCARCLLGLSLVNLACSYASRLLRLFLSRLVRVVKHLSSGC